MSASHTFLKIARQIHLYLGVLIAPSLLFFAFTGGLQVFSLHEAGHNSDYRPPAWLATLAQVHKNQTTVMGHHKPHGPDADEHAHDHPDAPAAPSSVAAPGAAPAVATVQADAPHQADHKNPLPLKIFFAFVALGLFISTLLGIYMSYRYTRNVLIISVLLLAGVIIPVALAVF